MRRLSEILDLTPQSYAERFRGSAMKRAKLTGLQRNARALLQNRERRGLKPVQFSSRSHPANTELSDHLKIREC